MAVLGILVGGLGATCRYLAVGSMQRRAGSGFPAGLAGPDAALRIVGLGSLGALPRSPPGQWRLLRRKKRPSAVGQHSRWRRCWPAAVIAVNKMDSAPVEGFAQVKANIAAADPKTLVVETGSALTLTDPSIITGERVPRHR